MRPTWQCFCRILVLAVVRRMPITLGTRHRTLGGGGGGVEVAEEAGAEGAVVVAAAGAEAVAAAGAEEVAAASVGEPEHVRNRCPPPGRLPRGGGYRSMRHALD